MASYEHPPARFLGPAIVQLNSLHLAGVLGEVLENVSVEAPGTPVSM